MYKIYKISSSPIVDYAAEELKKYLRMMMPRCGEIVIERNAEATEGFRLGIMADFGLDVSEADDIELDDILHIDTDAEGGIIAGSNPRSVLLAVYRYLTINGCRWLFPGIDGEFIPIKDIEPTRYHKMADMRYRGQCNEGAESQTVMIDAIDFTPKIGMNVFMLEFDIPKYYYDQYYSHRYNEANRESEPITPETVLQWKRQCEVEIAKRGLQFHDMGHGWTAEAFGIDTTDGWVVSDSEDPIPSENRDFVAMINGKRELNDGMALCTNFCMSNPDARKQVVKLVADYAQLAANVDYLHVWLADNANNYCECEVCRTKRPSDWYLMLMNDIDDELTARKLNTRIVFISYVDTIWPPETEYLKNKDRFSLLCAVSHNYADAADENIDIKAGEAVPFALNKNRFDMDIHTRLAYGKKWTDHVKIPSFLYEYHFFQAQYMDPGVFDFAKTVYREVRAYHKNGFNGVVEDCTQRAFWPNGFSFFVYASTLFDTNADFEALKEDYFSHAYGEDWREVVSFFEKLGKALDHRYFCGKMSADVEKGNYYNPAFVENCRTAKRMTAEFSLFLEEHKNMPRRAQTVSYRMLRRYMILCEGLAEATALKAAGLGEEAQKSCYEFIESFGKYELEMESCWDMRTMVTAYRNIFGKKGIVPLY